MLRADHTAINPRLFAEFANGSPRVLPRMSLVPGQAEEAGEPGVDDPALRFRHETKQDVTLPPFALCPYPSPTPLTRSAVLLSKQLLQ